MTKTQLVILWKERVCQPETDPDSEHNWFSLWVGFCLALEMDTFATYDFYMKLGFPQES